MDSLKKVEDVVYRVLEDYPEARNSDNILYSYVIRYNWSVEKALETPARIMNRSKGE